MAKPFLIFSLGGSLIVPSEVDVEYLRAFRTFVLRLVEKYCVVLICGGGKTCRKYQQAASSVQEVPTEDLDWIGIKTTLLNAQLVKSIFPQDKVCQHVVNDPTVDFTFTEDILVAGGWKPGHSTDNDAVLLAEKFDCSMVINLSNIEYAYDKDPKQFSDAKRIEQTTWSEFQKVVGTEWKPGLNAPFDPIASLKAAELGLTVAILNGKNLENLQRYLDGESFEGTVIRPT